MAAREAAPPPSRIPVVALVWRALPARRAWRKTCSHFKTHAFILSAARSLSKAVGLIVPLSLLVAGEAELGEEERGVGLPFWRAEAV